MNHQTSDGRTALLQAAYLGSLDLVKALIEKGGVNH